MTEAELIADLKARIAWLEKRVAELTEAKPKPDMATMYPKRPDEI